jgi:alpha-beta hydrolase superfamily lysophospholipase
MDEVRAILQISHGMSEYVDRYDRLADFLAQQGILVVGNDHLGHGETAIDDNELGYFPTKELSKTVVDDLYKVTKTIRAEYPTVPFFLMGHSMGSFMARRYMMTYGRQLKGAILMGTGSQPAATLAAARTIATGMAAVKGEKHRSKVMLKLAFGAYNQRIHPLRTEYDWLSRNADNVDVYLDDPHCGFMFTVNGYQTLFDVLSFIQDEKNIQKLPMEVPTLLLSGTDDPVGHYGKDIQNIQETYRKAGMKHIDMKLYQGDRHELLNELDYEQVQADILDFVENQLVS